MYCSSRNSARNGALRSHTRLSSSNPDGRTIFVRSSMIMFTQFVTMASVTAISRMMSRTRVLLWFMARKIGPIGMGSPLLQLELQGRRHRADAPGGIDAGNKSGHQRKKDSGKNHLAIEMDRHVRREDFGEEEQYAERKKHSDGPSNHADHLALNDVLQKDLHAAGAQGAADGNLRSAREELAEQQSDQVERTDRQEEHRHGGHGADLRLHDLEVAHRLHQIRHAIVE